MNREEIITRCIDEIKAGRSTVEECLARYPQLRDELCPLLELVSALEPEKVTPTGEFKSRTRRMLLEVIQSGVRVESKRRSAFGWLGALAPARAVSIAFIALIILVMSGGGAAYAAQNSLPGDILYPLKTGVENLQLVITFDPEAKADLHLKLAEKRINEVVIQSNLSREVNTSALPSVAKEIDEALEKMDKMAPGEARTFLGRLSDSTLHQQLALDQLLTAVPQEAQPVLKEMLAITKRGNLIAQVAYNNSAFLNVKPSVKDKSLEEGKFKLDGILLSIDGQDWNIGGVVITNVVSPKEVPPIGSRVKIEGLAKGNEVFISEIEFQEGEPEEKVKIEGRFGGTADGSTWYVGGIAVEKPENVTPPEKGEKIELKGETQSGSLTVTQLEKEEDREEKIELEGILKKVDKSRSLIILSTAGTQVTVNVSEATIRTEDGQSLKLADLESLSGEDVKVESLYKKDGVLYAKKVKVEVEHKSGEEKKRETGRGD